MSDHSPLQGTVEYVNHEEGFASCMMELSPGDSYSVKVPLQYFDFIPDASMTFWWEPGDAMNIPLVRISRRVNEPSEKVRENFSQFVIQAREKN
jgi:hypothetical protein